MAKQVNLYEAKTQLSRRVDEAAARLPRHHRVPFDRLMIAQAMVEDLTLIGNDAVFPRYRGLRVLAA